MHKNQRLGMAYFIDKYVSILHKDHISVIDVGSKDINGNDRSTFPEPKYSYTGCDIVSGPNVDIVLDSPDNWQDIGQFDVVITSSTIEHNRDVYKFVRNLASLAKPGGLVYVHCPFTFGCHGYPLDCWRIMPDGMRFLLDDIAKLDVIDTLMWRSSCKAKDLDVMGIARKPK